MRIKDEICERCFMPNYYDFTLKHKDPANSETNPLQRYCTYCKGTLKG